MTPEQVKRVQESWQMVVPIADQAAAMFYTRLFELDPSLESLFKTDLKVQGRKLTSMINTVVVSLSRLERVLPAVQDLGRRHVGYGVEESHYGTVGQALLWTLGKGLGDAFDDATKEAWTAAYGALSGVMTSAAAESPEGAAVR